ncbi:MAG: PIG-L family deacetylase [Gemmatimonadetes bacterium]|nr:PIG-L family deacetylase [Gemmatimonadota bacterium]
MRSSTIGRVSRLALAWLLIGGGGAQAQSLEDAGAVGVGLRLRQLDGVKRVLMIAAHPDDEDTSLLATLARGWGAETAYLSLTRGDGGQNAIGPELWEGLGVVRTGELEAARYLDGAEQFFTRAFDYGFSKSADEAFSLWPREELLADVVWVVRKFRPHVIVSVWSGTARDGHGQHQASGIIAQEAYRAAGDPTRFPEQLSLGVEAWAPSKFYQSARGGGRGGAPPADALRIETGQLDPLLGRSLGQLSAASRSRHRSQEMGSAETPGPRATGVVLVDSRVGNAQGIFAGIDTTLVGLTSGLSATAAAATRRELEAYRSAVARAREGMGLDPSAIADDLADAISRLAAAQTSAGSSATQELRLTLARKHELATQVFLAAAGVRFDVRTDDDLMVPGQTVRVRATVWNGGPLRLDRPEMRLDSPAGWRVTLATTEGLGADGAVAPGALATWTYDVALPTDASPSRLYYLSEGRDGARYRWPNDPSRWGLPRDPAPVQGRVAFAPATGAQPLASGRVETSEPWRSVTVEPTRGEVSRPVLVVPAVSVRVSPEGIAWPQANSAARAISVVVRTEAEGGSRGELSVRAPAGWSVTPARQAYALDQAGAERALSFEIRPSGTPPSGQHVFGVTARDSSGRTYTEGYTLVDYEHIDRAALYRPAEARVSVVPVLVAEGLRVGYVMGSGDDGPVAIRQLGVDVELLDENRVRDGRFEGLDVIVLGVRAYEARADLRAAADQLLDFARAGGVVIAQYNRESLGTLPPYSLVVGGTNPRVADERAPVRILAPTAPVFTAPNRITQADFDGWVQERGLYFGEEWDDAYWPLLEMGDPGEAPQRGSLLVAPVGDGLFVYSALAFFRQWASGVPGPYRLFANLLSLDPAAWRGFTVRP